MYKTIEVKDTVMKYSPEDHSLISGLTIYMQEGYCFSGGKSIHSLILPPKKGFTIDHVNLEKTDNRRENLRYFTRQQQTQNKPKASGTSSQYRGVYKMPNGKYRAQIRRNDKHIAIGCFDREIESAEAYDMYVVHNNMLQPLNFPLKREEYLSKKLIHPVEKTKSNPFIGVTADRDKFVAKICVDGKHITLMRTVDAVEAARAYDKYIFDNKLPNRKMNFPEKYSSFEPLREIRTQCIPHKTDNSIVYLIMNAKKDAVVLIDKNDYDKVKYYGCYVAGKGDVFISLNRTRKLSRYLMEVTDENDFVDHINRNKLDNTRGNLRITDAEGNAQNLTKRTGCTSEYYGVHYSQTKTRWVSSVQRKGIKKTICTSDANEETAGRRRDLYMMIYYPNDLCNFNFEWTEGEIIEWKTKLGY